MPADTVNDVTPRMARLLTASLALLAALAGLAAVTGLAAGPARAAATPRARPVVFIGVPGLRWTDISASATPALWRLAARGSVGSLVVSGVRTFTCPADAWLTLNSGARAGAPRPPSGGCAPLPPVTRLPGAGSPATGSSGGPVAALAPARVQALTGRGGIEAYNHQFSYSPDWGLLSRAGPGSCAVAEGQGAALALAGAAGQVGRYTPSAGGAPGAVTRSCPLVVAGLAALPASGPSAAAQAARSAAVRAADRVIGGLVAAAPRGAIIVVAGMGDTGAPHLRAIIVSGPGYGPGLLTAASTRRPGMVLTTDLTPSVLGWLGRPVPGQLVGSPATSVPRHGSLAAAVAGLTGQDTAAQVYRSTLAWYFVAYGFGEGIVFGLILLLLRGASPERRRRRRAAYRVAAVIAGAIPAGSFLAGIVPWAELAHPALVLYGLGLAWAALIAAVALAGPWRRDPLGPPGFVGAALVAVIGIDVITGSHLQLGTPFGLSALEAGRFYGIGNNAIGGYALGGLFCATWAGGAVARRTGSRSRAVAAAGAVALFTVVAAGWPGFGAKVGGTIAMVPGFLVLLAALAGIRITPRRAVAVGISGLLLITVFAVVNYLVPATRASDIGAFVGHVLHGEAGPILRRKIDANVGSVTETWFTPVVPVVVVVTGLALAVPGRLRLATLAAAMRAQPLLRPLLIALWLVAVLGWLANDSGVSVTAAALPLALPLVIAIVTSIAEQAGGGAPDLGANARTAPAPDRAG